MNGRVDAKGKNPQLNAGKRRFASPLFIRAGFGAARDVAETSYMTDSPNQKGLTAASGCLANLCMSIAGSTKSQTSFRWTVILKSIMPAATDSVATLYIYKQSHQQNTTLGRLGKFLQMTGATMLMKIGSFKPNNN